MRQTALLLLLWLCSASAAHAQQSKLLEFFFSLRYPWTAPTTESATILGNGGVIIPVEYRLDDVRGQYGGEIGFRSRPNPEAPFNFAYGACLGFNRMQAHMEKNYVYSDTSGLIRSGTARIVYFDLIVPLTLGIRLTPGLYLEPEVRGVFTLLNGSQWNYTRTFYPMTQSNGELDDLEFSRLGLELGTNVSYRFKPWLLVYGSIQYRLNKLDTDPVIRPAFVSLGLRRTLLTKPARGPLPPGVTRQ